MSQESVVELLKINKEIHKYVLKSLEYAKKINENMDKKYMFRLIKISYWMFKIKKYESKIENLNSQKRIQESIVNLEKLMNRH